MTESDFFAEMSEQSRVKMTIVKKYFRAWVTVVLGAAKRHGGRVGYVDYTLNGEEHNYIPDFIACIDDRRGPDDLLNLLVEVTGEKKKDKAAKVATARTLWLPAVNNHGGFGRWGFAEIADPWDAENLIRAKVGRQ
jgi:type III restriction enzyme